MPEVDLPPSPPSNVESDLLEAGRPHQDEPGLLLDAANRSFSHPTHSVNTQLHPLLGLAGSPMAC